MITGAQSEFINRVASVAAADAPLYGIKVISPIIAQAIIESGWGKSGLAVKGKNLFGVKCGSSWKGASINMATKEEYTPGQLTSIRANFRMYNSWEESIHDYFKFTSTKRYAALKNCNTPLEYCTAIKAAGYGTSSTYVNTLMKCINTYNLTIYDSMIGQVPSIPEPEPEPDITSITTISIVDYNKITDEVINGVWGNGTDRIVRLSNAGYNPSAIQFMVNQKVSIKDLTELSNKYYNIINKMKEVLNNDV